MEKMPKRVQQGRISKEDGVLFSHGKGRSPAIVITCGSLGGKADREDPDCMLSHKCGILREKKSHSQKQKVEKWLLEAQGWGKTGRGW